MRSDLPLVTVISGGQTGVDQAGLRAAKALGLDTGGFAPKGWKTLDGPASWLGTTYGLVESAFDYAGRTRLNVQHSDATVRIARFLLSPGERCTLAELQKTRKPYFDVVIGGAQDEQQLLWRPVSAFRQFLIRHRVRVLNVAGNSEQTAPGIGKAAERFLLQALGGE